MNSRLQVKNHVWGYFMFTCCFQCCNSWKNLDSLWGLFNEIMRRIFIFCRTIYWSPENLTPLYPPPTLAQFLRLLPVGVQRAPLALGGSQDRSWTSAVFLFTTCTCTVIPENGRSAFETEGAPMLQHTWTAENTSGYQAMLFNKLSSTRSLAASGWGSCPTNSRRRQIIARCLPVAVHAAWLLSSVYCTVLYSAHWIS